MSKGGYLLDTHVLLWAAEDAGRLATGTRALIDDPENDVLFSVVNLWEVTIKNALPRKNFAIDVDGLRRAAFAADYRELPVEGHHVLGLAGLPAMHSDPFDRILLAQATAEGLHLLTADARVLAYGDPARQA